MKKHSQYNDIEFAWRFEQCELDPAVFTHEAHLRLTWIHITLYGVKQAEENINGQLLSFVIQAGARDKFNKTLTIAAIRIIGKMISESNCTDFQEFILRYSELKTGFKGLIQRHYGFDIFTSENAKKEFIEPDLQPLD